MHYKTILVELRASSDPMDFAMEVWESDASATVPHDAAHVGAWFFSRRRRHLHSRVRRLVSWAFDEALHELTDASEESDDTHTDKLEVATHRVALLEARSELLAASLLERVPGSPDMMDPRRCSMCKVVSTQGRKHEPKCPVDRMLSALEGEG